MSPPTFLLVGRLLQPLKPLSFELAPLCTRNVGPAQQLVHALELRPSDEELRQRLEALCDSTKVRLEIEVAELNGLADALKEEIVAISRVVLRAD